ncbi:hypothetical protein SANTM175S_00998 [Streptomyces antimycoticus]
MCLVGPGSAPVRRTAVTVAQAEPERIAGTRQQLRDMLHDWADPDQVESAVLMLSEMVTNVLVHTDGDALLVAEVSGRHGSRRLRLDVADSSDELPHRRRPGGWPGGAAGVAVENLTVENNTQNGVLVTGSAKAAAGMPGQSGGYDTGDEPVTFLKSFLVSHVTATRNGLYGIYAFSAQNGVIEHSYTSGSADSGIYVGQCKPCRIVVRDNIAELNAVGYEGTNASGDMYVVGNRLVGNRVGLTTNSDHQEKLLPQRDAVIAGNLIAANQQAATPEQADGGWGIGIGVDGGTVNQFIRNRVAGNSNAGLVITATADIPPNGNRILDNTFAANGVDVGWTFPTATKGRGNCLRGNELRTTVPARLATTASCPRPARSSSPSGTWAKPTAPGGIPFTDVAAPKRQPRFPNATTAGATAVPAVPALPDTAGFRLPSASLLAAGARVGTS